MLHCCSPSFLLEQTRVLKLNDVPSVSKRLSFFTKVYLFTKFSAGVYLYTYGKYITHKYMERQQYEERIKIILR